MLKKVFVVLSLLVIGVALFLVTPLPRTADDDVESQSVPEAPTTFAPDDFGNDRECVEAELYVTPEQVGYTDTEIVDPRCARLQTELANAVIDGDLVQIRAALKKGASPTSLAFSKLSGDASPPIIKGAWSKQTEAIKLLLDNGADVNSSYVCCMNSKSLLMLAVSMNDEPTTKLLLQRGADLRFRDEFEGEDVFDIASRIDNPRIVAMLTDACERSVRSRVVCRTRRLRKFASGALHVGK